MTLKFLTVIFLCCLALTYVRAQNNDEKTKSPDAPDHEHGENCGHPLDKIKDGLVKIKNKISQTVTNAKNAVVEKYKNIKASIDKKKNGTATTTESYGRQNEPAVPREPSPPFVPPEVPQLPLGYPESDTPLPEGPDVLSGSNTGLPQGSIVPETNSSPVDAVNIDEAAVNQDPSLIDLPQNPGSDNPAIDVRFGRTPGPARIQSRRNLV